LKDVDAVHLRFKKGYDIIMVNKIAKLKGLIMTEIEKITIRTPLRNSQLNMVYN
jgi:hypothetical protein